MPSARKRKERERAIRRRRIRILGAVGVGVAVLLAVAIVASSGDDGDETAGVQTQQVTISGDPLPPLADAGADAAIGMRAAELAGRSFDGTSVTIANDGRPKAIWFLAHWCPHCQAEVPKIVDLVAQGVPSGVDLYSVSTGVDETASNYPPSAWLEREGWTIPVLADDEDGSAAQAYGLSGFPFLVLVGAEGTVVSRTSGEIDPGTLETMLEGLARSA